MAGRRLRQEARVVSEAQAHPVHTETERQRQRDRDRDRECGSDSGRDRDRERERERETETERQRDRDRERERVQFDLRELRVGGQIGTGAPHIISAAHTNITYTGINATYA